MVDFSTSKITLDGKHKQLIDLNKEERLFEAEFTVTPHTLDLDKKYEIAVVSQLLLDNDEITFKEVNGIYKGNVKHDSQDSEYENFFLVIKSNILMKDMVVEVSMKPIKVQPQMVQQIPQPVVEDDDELCAMEKYKKPEENFWSRNKVKLIILLFILIAGCYLLYYFWKKNQKASVVPEINQSSPPLQISEKFSSITRDAPSVKTTDKLFNPFNRRRGRSPPSIASSGFSKSPGSESSKSYVFEE